MFARKTWRLLGAALLLMVLVLGCAATASAADDPVRFTIQVDPESLTGPGSVKVSLRVSNSGDEDMRDPVTLYDPAGNVVAAFGDGGSYILKSGDSIPVETTWNVTQAELDAGEFAYTLKYHLDDDSGALVEFKRQAVAHVKYDGEHAALTVTRTIDPEVVRSGETATVTYELYNSGNVELKDIRIKEHIAKNAQTVKSLPAGERTTLKFTSKIGNADLVSSAEITYKTEGSTKTQSQKVDEATIPKAVPGLDITLSSDSTGVNIGEAAKLTITFTNKGNISYSNVSVSEKTKGEILTNLSIPAGATVTETKEFILTEPTTFKVTATLPDNTGNTKTLTSNELKLGVFDPEKVILLTLNLTAEPEAVQQAPADIVFHLTVTNNSNVKAENISIDHGSTHIYTIAALEPGESVTLDRAVTISQTGNYRFTASLKDSLNNTVTFDSETLMIDRVRPTAVPTAVPKIEVTLPPLKDAEAPDPLLTQGMNILWFAGLALGGLFALALILFAVSSIMRIRNRSKSNAAFDHLELAERRDYTEPADDPDRQEPDYEDVPVQETYDNDIPDLPPDDRQPADDRLIRGESQDGPLAGAPAGDGEGGYRISRSDVSQSMDEMVSRKAAEKTRQLEAAFADAKQTAGEAAEDAAQAVQEAVEGETPEQKPRRHSRRSRRTEDAE